MMLDRKQANTAYLRIKRFFRKTRKFWAEHYKIAKLCTKA